MFLDICVPLFLIGLSLCSVSARRFARDNNLDVSLQKRAQPVSGDQLSLYTLNDSTTDAGIVLQTSLGHNYLVTCQRTAVGLQARDCFTALRQSPTSDVQEIWATRQAPPSMHADVRLPVVLFSGRY